MAIEQRTQDVSVDGAGKPGSESLTVTDNRTDKTYELPITDGTVKTMDLRQIKVSEDDFGLMGYDPGFTNTASCRSAITYIDGEAGILQHRGYPIEQLCEQATYLEVAYLLVYGELPTQAQLDLWTHDVTHHTFVHEDIKKFLEGFRYDAHPMGMLLASVGALSTFYPDAKKIDDPEERYLATIRLIAKMPTLAAFSYRHNMGLPYVYPDNDLSYPENFLAMLFKMTEVEVQAGRAAGPGARRALHPPRRPRAELLDERGARRSAPPTSTPTRRWRRGSPRSTVRFTAAPTRRCCGCCGGSSPSRTSPTSSRASRSARSG